MNFIRFLVITLAALAGLCFYVNWLCPTQQKKQIAKLVKRWNLGLKRLPWYKAPEKEIEFAYAAFSLGVRWPRRGTRLRDLALSVGLVLAMAGLSVVMVEVTANTSRMPNWLARVIGGLILSIPLVVLLLWLNKLAANLILKHVRKRNVQGLALIGWQMSTLAGSAFVGPALYLVPSIAIISTAKLAGSSTPVREYFAQNFLLTFANPETIWFQLPTGDVQLAAAVLTFPASIVFWYRAGVMVVFIASWALPPARRLIYLHSRAVAENKRGPLVGLGAALAAASAFFGGLYALLK